MERLETLAGLSQEDAREVLLHKVDEELTHEKARCAADHSSETTVSVVPLPNDEMKGRIIGREGRNIRAIETPPASTLSSTTRPRPSPFPASSRFAARLPAWRWKSLSPTAASTPPALRRWWKRPPRGGASIKREGERAVLETGIRGLHPELVKLLGRLHYRTSYGQNVLHHSIEVSISPA